MIKKLIVLIFAAFVCYYICEHFISEQDYRQIRNLLSNGYHYVVSFLQKL